MTHLSWSRDGSTLCGSAYDEVALLGDSGTGRLRESVQEAEWNPQGRLHAVLAAGRLTLRETATGRQPTGRVVRV